MSSIEGDSTNIVINLGADIVKDLIKLGGQGIKLTGSAAKNGLLKVLENSKVAKENKGGLIAVKNILSSKDEIQLVKLNKEHLGALKEKAKEYGVSFGCIGSKNQSQVKVIFKASKASLMQEVLKDILEMEKAKKQQMSNDENSKQDVEQEVKENTNDDIKQDDKKDTKNNVKNEVKEDTKEDIIDNAFDFSYLGEDCYRRKVDETNLVKLIDAREQAKKEIKDIELLVDGEGNFYFKCGNEHKEKLDKIVDELNRKDLDKIISDAQDKAKGDRGEEEKVPLKEQLKNLDEEMKENVNRINSENSKKKSKSKNKDDKGAR